MGNYITEGQLIFNGLNQTIKRTNLQVEETIEALNNHPLTILKVSFADIVKKDIGEIGLREKIMELLIPNKKAKQEAVGNPQVFYHNSVIIDFPEMKTR